MFAFYHNAIPASSGIYRITCTITKKIYVGSAVNLRERRKGHFGDLQRNEHHSITLQRAWNKYGPDAFTFEIIELVLTPFLIAREQFYLDTLKPFGNKGYNIARVAGSTLGVKPSPLTRARMSTAHQGRKHTSEACEKISASKRGKPRRKLSPEASAKLHAGNIGNTYTLGYKHTSEARAKMGVMRRGTKRSPETREKIRLAALKRPPAKEETVAKIAAKTRKTLIIIEPDGTEHLVTGVKKFCKEHGLITSSIMYVAKGVQHQHKGWTARFPNPDVG